MRGVTHSWRDAFMILGFYQKSRFLLCLALLLGITACGEQYKVGELESVYAIDGDTLRYKKNGQTFTVRVMGVDTPEIKGQCQAEIKKAQQAKVFTKNLLRNASTLTLTQLDKNKDKYGRLLRQVKIDGQRLDKALIKAKLGREYYGGKRKSWCDD